MNCVIVFVDCMFITQNLCVSNTEVELQKIKEGEGFFTANM